MSNRNTALFGLMCLIWGLTWIAVKAGVQAVPPMFFAGSRFVVAGVLIGAGLYFKGERIVVVRKHAVRLAVVSALMITGCYGLLFWGLQYVSSGTGALLELSFTPVALLGFALLLGQEHFDWRRASAIALGIVGLAILFGPKMSAGTDRLALLGSGATVLAAIVYAWGSVLAKPLIAECGPWSVAATTMFAGGIVLLVGSFLTEAGAPAALSGHWGLAAWAGWLFLLVFGSLCGFTVFLYLLQVWGASKAGSFAFVSPVIAVLAGMAVFGETMTLTDGMGMVVMMCAAAIAVRTEPKLKGVDSQSAIARGAAAR